LASAFIYALHFFLSAITTMGQAVSSTPTSGLVKGGLPSGYLDEKHYRTAKTNRGLEYYYYHRVAQGDKPTLVFIHGFPSTSNDWRRIIPFWQDRGYGILCPDMLGYGGTSKPLDYKLYKGTLMAQDIVDLIDHADQAGGKKIEKVISFSHDWGCLVNSRLADRMERRIVGHVFLALSYMPPLQKFDYYQTMELTKEAVGWSLYGYWKFYAKWGDDSKDKPDPDTVVERHFNAHTNLLYPTDPEIWKEYVCPEGGMEKWLLGVQKKYVKQMAEDRLGPLPSYMADQDVEHMRKVFLPELGGGGLKAPMNWYKAMMNNVQDDPNGDIVDPTGDPLATRFHVCAPSFVGVANQDYVGEAKWQTFQATKHLKLHTVEAYDADHWLLLSHADEINDDIKKWLSGLRL